MDKRKLSISESDYYQELLNSQYFYRKYAHNWRELFGTIEELKTGLLEIIDGLDYTDVQQYRKLSIILSHLALREESINIQVLNKQIEESGNMPKFGSTWGQSAYYGQPPIASKPEALVPTYYNDNIAPIAPYVEFYQHASIFVAYHLNETNKYKSLIPQSKIDAALMYMYNVQTVEEAYILKRQKTDIEKLNFGHTGEAEVDYALKWLVGDYINVEKKKCEKNGIPAIVLKNKEFIDEPQEFDYIIIGTQGIFNIETKNYTGKLIIDTNGNLIRIKADGNEIGERNPIQQIRRHEAVLKSIVGKNIPIISILVMANPQMIIEGIENFPIPLLKSDRLEEYISSYKNGKTYTKSEITEISNKLERYRVLK